MLNKKARKVTIYSPKNDTKLCEIEAPQKWWADIPIPLPFALISFHTAWMNPDTIVVWAWRQAWITALALNEIGAIERGAMLSPDFRCRCLICGQDSIAIIGKHWFWSNHYKHVGFSCVNRDCSVYNVLIPNILLSHIEEIPKVGF